MAKGIFLSALILLLSAQPIFGQWRLDGVPVCTEPDVQDAVNIVTDGAGGAIIIWRHYYWIGDVQYVEGRAQRIDSEGALLWWPSQLGVQVIPNMSNRLVMDAIPDGAGGAIFVFMYQYGVDDKDLYAQRVNESGSPLWDPSGKPVCTEDYEQSKPASVSDGSGGAIIVWEDSRYGAQDTYAQRVSGAGICLWALDGIAISLAGGAARSHAIATDGSDGAIMVWQDSRLGDWDIFAQRVDPDGVVYWANNGIAIFSATNLQINPLIVSDGSHGGVIVWEDWRDGYENACLYAQRVNSNGNVMWDASGELVCALGYSWMDFAIVSDGSGGAIVTWVKACGEDEYDIYAQRVGSNGTMRWGAEGVVVCDVPGGQGYPAIISDGAGGAIIVWGDYSTGTWKYYAQRLDEDGNALWPEDGVAICDQAVYYGQAMTTTDGAGGAIFAWADRRGDSQDIYAQRIDAEGTIVTDSGVPAASPRLYANYPNPFNPTTTVRFYLPGPSHVRLDIYDVTGAFVTRLASGVYEEGLHAVPWDGRAADGSAVSSGVYFCRLVAGERVLSHKMVLLR